VPAWPKRDFEFLHGYLDAPSRSELFAKCVSRLVAATPEEKVRQAFIRYPSEELGVPLGLLMSEVPMSHWDDQRRGRADLVGEDSTGGVFLLVECKSEILTDHAIAQLDRYNEVLGAPISAICNGENTWWYQDDELLDGPPTYKEMRSAARLPRFNDDEPDSRPQFNDVSDAAREPLDRVYSIGEGSDAALLPFLYNFAGLVHLGGAPEVLNGLPVGRVAEAGRRFTNFKNHVGGSWPGGYIYYLVERDNGDAEIVSVSILRGIPTQNDPRFGNRPGHTMMVVAIDDAEQSHLSLEYDLDRYVEFSGDQAYFWHNGTLSRGRRGMAKRSEVLEFLTSRYPELVTDGRVLLGSLPTDQLITWGDAHNLLRASVLYGIARDEFRRES
jgi:hypothetical protein